MGPVNLGMLWKPTKMVVASTGALRQQVEVPGISAISFGASAKCYEIVVKIVTILL